MFQRCPTCMAVGHCPECGGRGSVETHLHGNVRLKCEACEGTGKCPDCNGHGKIRAAPRDTSLIDVLQSQYDASVQRDREANALLLRLRREGVDPGAPRYAQLRDDFGIWVGPQGKVIARPRREITDDSSLYDVLLEEQDRSDAVLGYLRALEKQATD